MIYLLFLLIISPVHAQTKTQIQIDEAPAIEVSESEKDISWSLLKMQVKEAQELVAQETSQRNPYKYPPIIVAVIDTGIQLDHPSLENFIFHNPFETRSRTGLGKDDDNNGFIDDFYGWNFENETNEVDDDFGHGTHVAGIIQSICPNVRLMSVKWMKDGLGWGTDAIEGIRYAVKMGARVINASWGGIGYTKDLEAAVKEAEAQGVLFVSSAGNKGTNNDVQPRHPANLKLANVISVANTNEQDELDKTSNYGAHTVHVAAPGVNIISTIRNNGYGKMSGTSMSAAAVSGVAALLLSLKPELTATELKAALIETAEVNPALQGKIISGARVNALKAAKKVLE